MLRHRYFISYFSTALLYLLLLSAFFYIKNTYFISLQNSQEQTICFSLAHFVPEPTLPEEETSTETEPEIKKEPLQKEPVLEKKAEKPMLEPLKPELKIRPRPVVKKEVAQKEKVQKKHIEKVKKKQQKKKSLPKLTKIVKKKNVSTEKSKAKENEFLAKIRAKINQHKTYPRMAQKRGMQGSVNVGFTILPSGKVGNITIDGPNVFHNSARYAVEGAFPIDVKDAPISLPKSIHITLRYQMK